MSDLIILMLTPDPKLRPSINEVIAIIDRWQSGPLQLNVIFAFVNVEGNGSIN